MEGAMSIPLLQAVLSSNHTKSSTRFAQALLAYHACSRCGRVYVSVTRLANELNANLRNTKALLAKLRDEKLIEPTGETTPQGVIVYRLVGVSIPTPDDSSRDESDTRGVSKSCWFCRREVSIATPNRHVFDRHENNDGAEVSRRRQGEANTCVGYPPKGGKPRACDACGHSHFPPS
jgi:hypothetical protein